MKVLYLTNVPSPYMVDFFNEFGKSCSLTVIFEKTTSSERDKSWQDYHFKNFKGIILRGITTDVDKAFAPQIIRYIRKNEYDYIVVTNPATPTGIFAILFMKFFGIKYILESEGGFAKSGIGLKEWLKKKLFQNAFAYFSTTPKADEYFLKYGAVSERIYKIPFTSVSISDVLPEPLSKKQKLELKEKLGIRGKKSAIAVGRFIKLKNYDLLIECWKNVDQDYFLYIVGSGEEKENYLKKISEYEMKNVVIIDFLRKEALNLYYAASDLFIHPTSSDVWGLVINEAMAKGLPVITTHNCIAGLELVSDNINGFIVSVEDTIELKSKIDLIFGNEDLIRRMSNENLSKIKWYTTENMAYIHIKILEEISKTRL